MHDGFKIALALILLLVSGYGIDRGDKEDSTSAKVGWVCFFVASFALVCQQ
jgi:hypothetical protein